MNRHARSIGAALLGAALIGAFPPFDLWFLALVVPGAFALLVRDQPWRRAALLGLLFGLGFFVPMLHWTGMETGPVPWLLLGGLEALFFVPLGIGLMLVQRLPGWPVWTAAVWVADEAIRGRIPYGGFTWGKLAFSQADGPVLGAAAVGGSPGLSFVVALCSGLLAWAAVTRTWRMQVLAVAGAGVLALAPTLLSAPPSTGESTSIAVVQGNVPEDGLDQTAEARAITRHHVETTERLAASVDAGRLRQPDVVFWPENSSDISPFHDAATYRSIDAAVRAVEAPVLVSAIVPTDDEQNVRNTSILWDPDTGPGDTYVKRHPMPFGEYIPFRSIAERITAAVEQQPRDHVPGHEVGIFRVGSTTIGDVICFEVAFDGVVRDAVRAGAQYLSVQTNNATFGYSEMTEQQLAQSRVRAVEHGRTVVVSALAGVSAVVAPDGAVLDRTELFTQDVLLADVPLVEATTLATDIGAWPEWVLTAVALGVVVFVLVNSRIREGAAGEPEEPVMVEAGVR